MPDLLWFPHCCACAVLLQVFCASESVAHEEMRQACFDYLALGGMYSGKRGRPMVLLVFLHSE